MTKKVQVVEFRDPFAKNSGSKRERDADDTTRREKKLFMGSDIAKSNAAARGKLPGAPTAFRGNKKSKSLEEDVFSSIKSYGASSFQGKDKKIWEAKQLEAIGAKVSKHTLKMPFKMYQGVTKAQKKREKRRELEVKYTGAVTGKKAAKKERKKWADDDITPGNIRGPVMYIK